MEETPRQWLEQLKEGVEVGYIEKDNTLIATVKSVKPSQIILTVCNKEKRVKWEKAGKVIAVLFELPYIPAATCLPNDFD